MYTTRNRVARSMLPGTVVQRRQSVFVLAFLLLALSVSPSRAMEFPSEGLGDFVSVVGGQASQPQQFSSVVALVYTDNPAFPASQRTRHFCGGTLIARKWVLTAAHCFYDFNGFRVQADQVRVIAGTTDLDAGGAESVVLSVFLHPEYIHGDSRTLADIALMELAFDESVSPTQTASDDTDTSAGTLAATVGWGATRDSRTNPGFPTSQRFGVVPLVSRETCNQPHIYAGTIEESQICAGFQQGGVDGCSGDSGGPLFVEEQGVREVLGIVSFGAGCALPEAYGVYTNVAFYRSWIDGFLGESSQNNNEPAVGQGTGDSIGDPTLDSDAGGGAISGLFLVFAFFGWRRRSALRSENTESTTRGHTAAPGQLHLAWIFSLLSICTLSACSTSAARDGSPLAAASSTGSLQVVNSAAKPPPVGTVQAVRTTELGYDAQTLSVSDALGRLGLDSVRLGESRTSVQPRLQERLRGPGQCEDSSLALKNSRRAYRGTDCVWPLADTQLGDADVNEIGVRYIDGWLVSIDIQATGTERAVASLKRTFDSRFGPSAVQADLAARGQVYVWELENDRAVLGPVMTYQDAANSTRSALSLRMVDARAAQHLAVQ